MKSNDALSRGEPFPIVGKGASAGGLVALEPFLSHVPPASGMAFVIDAPTSNQRGFTTRLMPDRTQARLAALMKYSQPQGVADGLS